MLNLVEGAEIIYLDRWKLIDLAAKGANYEP